MKSFFSLNKKISSGGFFGDLFTRSAARFFRASAFTPFLMTTAIASSSLALSMPEFLTNCGYGIAIGAGAGALTAVTSSNPGANVPNIAKGASLGLYGGILYSIAINANQKTAAHPYETEYKNPSEPTQVWISPTTLTTPHSTVTAWSLQLSSSF